MIEKETRRLIIILLCLFCLGAIGPYVHKYKTIKTTQKTTQPQDDRVTVKLDSDELVLSYYSLLVLIADKEIDPKTREEYKDAFEVLMLEYRRATIKGCIIQIEMPKKTAKTILSALVITRNKKLSSEDKAFQIKAL